jgi:hypothetical protein
MRTLPLLNNDPILCPIGSPIRNHLVRAAPLSPLPTCNISELSRCAIHIMYLRNHQTLVPHTAQGKYTPIEIVISESDNNIYYHHFKTYGSG